MAIAAPALADRMSSANALLSAYPGFLNRIEGGQLVWKDGTRMPLDDGQGRKSLERMLDKPDIEDMFSMAYPKGRAGTPPAPGRDPGRVRYAPLFDKMYGNCREGRAAAKLITVDWLPSHGGGKLKFTAVNGAAGQLRKVSAALDRLPGRFAGFLTPSAGTYNCRPIAGTARTSAHGWGIAIDINPKRAHYWRWTKPDSRGRYPWRNAIPAEIVDVFEQHGFIWGGKWYHYDTMHFEFRPELVTPIK
ncbi:MAG: M15 family metallopeptidase [Hyphomicrobiaceae bacterium]